MARPSFDSLYRSEFGPVRAFLFRLGASGDDLVDLTHDTFLTALRRFETYDASRAARPWFLGIAFRTFTDFAARHRTTRERLQTPPEVPIEGDAERRLVDRQQRSLIERALESLDPVQRAVLLMHHFDELTPAEISAAMDAPQATTYTRLRTARTALVEAVRRLEGSPS